MLADINASKKVIEVLKDRYAKRSSGFTRMTPVGQRQGDGALLVDLSLVDSVEPTEKATEEKTPKASTPKKSTSKASST